MAYVGLEQVAQVLKLTPQMINRHVRLNGMPRVGRGEYELIKCVHWYIDYKDRLIKEARSGSESEAQARQRLVVATADLREVELAEACGELIEMWVATKLWERLVGAFRSKMEILPSKISPQIAGITDVNVVRQMLQDEIIAALKELSNEKLDTSSLRRSRPISCQRRQARRTKRAAKRQPLG